MTQECVQDKSLILYIGGASHLQHELRRIIPAFLGLSEVLGHPQVGETGTIAPELVNNPKPKNATKETVEETLFVKPDNKPDLNRKCLVEHKKECGHMGINQNECESRNCCWKPSKN